MDVQLGDVHLDRRRDVGRQALDLEVGVTMSRRPPSFLTPKAVPTISTGTVDAELLVEEDPHEVDVQEGARDRVERHVPDHDVALLVGPLQLQLEIVFSPIPLRIRFTRLLRGTFERERLHLLAAAVDHGRDLVVRPQSVRGVLSRLGAALYFDDDIVLII